MITVSQRSRISDVSGRFYNTGPETIMARKQPARLSYEQTVEAGDRFEKTAGQPLFGKTFPPALYTGPTLGVFDWDNSLLPYDGKKRVRPGIFKSNISAINQAVKARQMTPVINTVRGLTGFKKHAARLDEVHGKIQGFFLNNGAELYLKPDDGQSYCDWLAGLHEQDQNAEYREFVQKTAGWRISTVLGTVQKVLLEKGFKLAPESIQQNQPEHFKGTLAYISPDTPEYPEKILVMFYPDEPTLFIKGVAPKGLRTPAADAVAQELTKAVTHHLKAQNIESVATEAKRLSYINLTLSSPRINKAVPIQYLLKHSGLPFESVMPCGDSAPDLPMLLPETWTAQDERPVKNYPILSGGAEAMAARLHQNPRLTTTSREGDLADSIAHQLSRQFS